MGEPVVTTKYLNSVVLTAQPEGELSPLRGVSFRADQSSDSGIATVHQLIDCKPHATLRVSKKDVRALHALLGQLLDSWVV